MAGFVLDRGPRILACPGVVLGLLAWTEWPGFARGYAVAGFVLVQGPNFLACPGGVLGLLAWTEWPGFARGYAARSATLYRRLSSYDLIRARGTG